MRFPMIALPMLLALGCTGVRVHHDYDTRADFAAYRTFDWKANRAQRKGEGVEALAARRVIHAVEQELAAKGFRQEVQGRPDLLVSYTPRWEKRKVHQGTTVATGWGRGPFRVGTATRIGRTFTYKEGSILLSFTDERTGEVVWAGEAEDVIQPGESAEASEARIAVAIQKLLASFPPKR